MEPRDSLEDFKELCRHSIERSIEDRMRYGFCYVYKPVLDDAPWRSFDSTKAYRKWCRENLPEYLGYSESAAGDKSVIDDQT
jgi:hypothetical protein